MMFFIVIILITATPHANIDFNDHCGQDSHVLDSDKFDYYVYVQ